MLPMSGTTGAVATTRGVGCVTSPLRSSHAGEGAGACVVDPPAAAAGPARKPLSFLQPVFQGPQAFPRYLREDFPAHELQQDSRPAIGSFGIFHQLSQALDSIRCYEDFVSWLEMPSKVVYGLHPVGLMRPLLHGALMV